MALIKTIQTLYGIDAAYHRIAKVEFNYISCVSVFTVLVYASAEARDAGGEHLQVVECAIPLGCFVGDLREPSYTALASYYGSNLFVAAPDQAVITPFSDPLAIREEFTQPPADPPNEGD